MSDPPTDTPSPPRDPAVSPPVEMPSVVEVTAGGRARALGEAVVEWVKKDLKFTLLFMVLAALLSWLGNVVLVAVYYDGIGKVPDGAPAIGSANQVTGSIFWGLLMAIIFGLIAYRMQVGGKRFWADVRGFPGSLSRLLRNDGNAALGHILWGVAGSMLVAATLAPTVSLVFAGGFLVLMGRVLRGVITGLLMKAWRAIVGFVAPGRKMPPREGTFGVAMFGAVVGFAAAYIIPDPSLKLLAALAAGVAAFVLTRPGKPKPALTLWLLALGGVALLFLSREIHALAADGGWRENGGDLRAWLNGGGFGVITGSQPAALAGAAGGLLGPGLSNGVTTQPTEEQLKARYLKAYIRANGSDTGFDDWWQQTGFHHADGPTTGQAFLDGLVGQFNAVKGEFTNFDYSGFFNSLGQDFASGDMRNRLWAMDQSMVNTFIDQTNKQIIQPLGVAADFWTHPNQWGDVSQLAQPTKEALQTSFDFWSKQGLDGWRQVGGELVNMTQGSYNEIQGKMNEFNAAVAAGDNEKASRMIGELAGNAEFQALMAKGPDAALEKLSAFKTAVQDAKAAKALEEANAARGLGKADILYGPEGQVLTAEDMARIGVDPEKVKALQAALGPGEELHLKPGSEQSIAWRDSGASGKPVEIKAKSGNELDQYIGLGGPNDNGLVTYGAPEVPAKPPGMSSSEWAKIEPDVNARYAQKLSEFHDQAAAMQKMAIDGVDMNINGQVQHVRIDWKGGGEINGKPFGDNVVYAITADGTKVPIAGDVDMFTYKGAGTSQDMYPKFAQAEPGIAHHADTPNWNPDSAKLQDVRSQVLWDHSANNPNAQNVIKLTNDSITTTLGPAVTPPHH
ncbi:MAG: hypothetical protein ACR2MY_02335 [Candidatus Dormibacteria bacterium]